MYACSTTQHRLQPFALRVPLTLVLDTLPLSGLRALDDGLAEKGAHLLDSESKQGVTASDQPKHMPVSKRHGRLCATHLGRIQIGGCPFQQLMCRAGPRG